MSRGGFKRLCGLGAFRTGQLHMLGRLILQKARERKSPGRTFSFSSRPCIRTSSIHLVSDLLGHIQQTGINALLMSLGCAANWANLSMENDSLRELHCSPHFIFSAQRPQYGTALDSKSGHVPLSLHGKISMALGKPGLMISMTGSCLCKWNYNEQILAFRLNLLVRYREDYPHRMSELETAE